VARVEEQVVNHTRWPRDHVWARLTDTDRLNRASGLAPIVVARHEGHGASRFRVETAIGPLSLDYEELPFEWRAPEWFGVRRRILSGPVRELEVHFALTPERQGDVEGTRIETRVVGVLTSGVLGGPGRLLARLVLSKMQHAIDLLLEPAPTTSSDTPRDPAGLRGPAPRPSWTSLPPRRASLRPGHLEARARLVAEATPRAQPHVDALFALIESADDTELLRMRPYDWAEQWRAPRRAALELALSAVTAGVLDLEWALVCPSCRGGAETVSSLRAIADEGHCHACDLRFGLELDRAVEATFRPTRALRAVDDRPFCIGGPARTPHVEVQRVVRPGDRLVLEAPPREGRHRLFARGGATAALMLRADAPDAVDVRLDARGFTPDVLALAPGGAVRLEVDGGDERHVKLEALRFADRAATAHDLSQLPAFRARFSAEVLRPDLALKVSRATLLFTDLGASTALYAARGDARAFHLVQAHFALLAGIIDAHGGAVVKTIGDAVMASFTDEGAGLAAALEMLERFPRFRAEHADAASLSLKLGLHAGPAYVVTANGALDYFGQSVNMAARIQGQARDDELVLAPELAAPLEAGVHDGALARERFVAALKGIDGGVELVRVRRI
jgi:class 3 adenylate cyclase